MPNNAQYTSAEFQNEIIGIMDSVLTNKIIEIIYNYDGGLYTIKCDETKYRSGIELLTIIIRCIKEGEPNEILLCVIEIKELNSKYSYR